MNATAIPRQLRDMEFVLLSRGEKRPIHRFKTDGGCRLPYGLEVIAHLRRGEPVAVYLTGNALVVDIEREALKHPQVEQVLEDLPPTFTVRSGGGGQHHYYHVEGWEEQINLDLDGVHVGEVRAPGKAYCLVPPSPHPSGDKYRVMVDRPITHISEGELRRILSPLGVETLEERKKREIRAWGEQQARRVMQRLRRQNRRPHNGLDARTILDQLDLPSLVGFEGQGPHPVHGSKTGRNLKVSAEHQTWYCFRHNTWGDPLEWIALEEGIISCEDARKGENAGPCLRGEDFKEALRAAADLAGIDAQGWKE